MSFMSEMKELWKGRRAIGDRVGNWWNGYRTVRVAVIGGKASGKTVFLTALANHLQNHDGSVFPLGVDVIWDPNENQQEELHGFRRFPYSVAHDKLGQGEWPDKTFSESILAMRLKLTHPDGRQEYVQLELLDIPGERIADFVMLDRSYEEWCRWMQKSLAGPDGKNAAYRDYLKKVEVDRPDDESVLLDAYRDYLKKEFESFSPFLTPSTIKLGLGGKKEDLHGSKTPEGFREAISSVPIGFTDEDGTVNQFVPLPESCLGKEAWRDMITRFGIAYDRYKAKVLLPTKDWLEGDWRTPGATKLFYLVDTLHLLQEGEKAWCAQKECGEAIIGMLCPRKPYVAWRRGWEWLKGVLWKTRIDTVYVVATKSDRVCSDQRNNLANLAKALLGRALDNLADGVTSDVLSCAAVCATQEKLVDGERGLQGWLVEEGAERQCGSHTSWIPSTVPPVPPRSAEEWKNRQISGEFNYPEVFPGFAFSTGQSQPPQYLGLNTLVKEMLAE